MTALDWFLVAAVIWCALLALYWRGKCEQLLAEHRAYLLQCQAHEAEHDANIRQVKALLAQRVEDHETGADGALTS